MRVVDRKDLNGVTVVCRSTFQFDSTQEMFRTEMPSPEFEFGDTAIEHQNIIQPSQSAATFDVATNPEGVSLL
jgi:hypothetical protein